MQKGPTLVALAEAPQAIDWILRWNLEVWGERIPGYDMTGWSDFYERCLVADYSRFDGLSELAWAIYLDDELVGSIALVHEDDLDEFSDLSPWMAAFVINPSRRHHGIGRRVVDAFEEHCRALGIATLFLWTDTYTNWYRSLGYEVIAHSGIRATDQTIIEFDVMKKAL